MNDKKMTRTEAMVGFEEIAYRPAKKGEWILCCDNQSNFSTHECYSSMKRLSAVILKKV